MKTVVSVLGTRPEIVKFAPLLPLLEKNCRHILVHTGQHYSPLLDSQFFIDLELKLPKHRLNVKSHSGSVQIGLMLERLGKLFSKIKPHTVLVQGDTNSTLAGAIAGAKCGARLVHIEAGCRSFRKNSPEEQNRKLVDHISHLHFAPDARAKEHLWCEGIRSSVFVTGSTALETAAKAFSLLAKSKRKSPSKVPFALATLHRAENTGDPSTLRKKIQLMEIVAQSMPVIFPVHPRTRKQLAVWNIRIHKSIHCINPLGYFDFLWHLKHAHCALSDSGGVQEEAALAGVPCIVLREETEWLDYVQKKRNFLVGESERALRRALAEVPFARNRAKRNPIIPLPVANKMLSILKKQKFL